jgi:histidinol-phosphate aminotransferase
MIFLGNGSDEAIDLLFRAFCCPGRDEVIIMSPTYGMYEVCADLNDIRVRKIPLTPDFDLDIKRILKNVTKKTKLTFICSPNNPSANLMKKEDIQFLLDKLSGLLVLDEAYIDFSDDEGFLNQLVQYENLVILQTFSKAWGMAGLRLGMAFANPQIIDVLTKIKYPYNVSVLTQRAVSEALDNINIKQEYVKNILEQRSRLIDELGKLRMVKKIYPSQTNFILIRFENAQAVYKDLLKRGIIVRDRSGVLHCEECLRITVGTADENNTLVAMLAKIDHI